MPLKIKDILVVAMLRNHINNRYPIGEACSEPVATIMTFAERQAMRMRLFTSINKLIDKAHADHLKHYKSEDTQQIDLDYITRISTNEFFFYTQEPLTIAEFTQLQNQIAKKMRKLPPGIQLILGSFAVKSDDNHVANVTPHISSGDPPKFHFIVKNFTSTIDVTYKENIHGKTISLKSLENDYTNALPRISIEKTINTFTFNSLISCHTPAGNPFITAVEICLDHLHSTTLYNILDLINTQPYVLDQPISHVIISNSICTIYAHCCLGIIHIDPEHSIKKYNTYAINSLTAGLSAPTFGNDQITIFDLPPNSFPKVLNAINHCELFWDLFAVANQLHYENLQSINELCFQASTLEELTYIFNKLKDVVIINISTLQNEVFSISKDELDQTKFIACWQKLMAIKKILTTQNLGTITKDMLLIAHININDAQHIVINQKFNHVLQSIQYLEQTNEVPFTRQNYQVFFENNQTTIKDKEQILNHLQVSLIKFPQYQLNELNKLLPKDKVKEYHLTSATPQKTIDNLKAEIIKYQTDTLNYIKDLLDDEESAKTLDFTIKPKITATQEMLYRIIAIYSIQLQQKQQQQFDHLISEFNLLKFGDNDSKINHYFHQMRQVLERNDILEIHSMLNDVTNTLEQMQGNKRLILIRDLIKQFRDKAGMFTIGMKDKANKIERVMARIPITDRCSDEALCQNEALSKAINANRYWPGKLFSTPTTSFTSDPQAEKSTSTHTNRRST